MSLAQADVDRVYALLDLDGDGTFGPVNVECVMGLVPRIISVIQQSVTEPQRGPYKKQLAVALLKKVVDEHLDDAGERQALHTVIDTAVPVAIDTIIGVARGVVDVGKKLQQRIQNGGCCTVA